MKGKAGDGVEGMRRNKEPYGSGFPVKILPVDDYQHTVRYKRFLSDAREPVIEKVPEKIKPAPDVHMEKRWIRGAIVEVFDHRSWRSGKIMKALQNNYFVVRVFDTIKLKEFHVSNLRAQQSWYEDPCAINDKVRGNRQIALKYSHLKSKYTTGLHHRAKVTTCEEVCSGERVGQDQDAIFSPTGSRAKNHATTTGKGNILDGSHRRNRRALPKTVDVIPSSRSMMHNHCMQLPIKYRLSMFSKMDVDAGNTEGRDRQSPPSRSFPIVEESNDSSVASCSSNNLPKCVSRNARKCSRELSSSLFDGSSSSCPINAGEEYPSVPREKLAADLHAIELHAYQSTLQALYASGPMSWEQESLLTNLRLSLHITNEEHLLQLRNLLSA